MQTTILPQNQKSTSVNPIFTPVNNQIFKLPNFLTISKDASSTFNQGEQVQKSKKRKKRKL